MNVNTFDTQRPEETDMENVKLLTSLTNCCRTVLEGAII